MTIETSAGTQLVAGTWTIDPSHSEIGFTVRHLMTKVRGSFATFEGAFTTTADNVAETRVEASIDLNSVDTGDEQRDGHLRSADFFDVEKTGPMTFATTSFDGSAATGDLTIKGVTRPVELEVEFLGVETDHVGNTRIGFEASGLISRKTWGVDFNVPLDGGKLLVGDKVTLDLSVQAILDS